MELQRDKSLERFRTEYEKLFKAVRKSHGRSQLPVFALHKHNLAYEHAEVKLHHLRVVAHYLQAVKALSAASLDKPWCCSAVNLNVLCCCPDNEKRLTKKVKELNGEIVGNAAKVQTALRLSEEDQTTIVTLKKEVEKAWKLVDASHEKVTTSRVWPSSK